MIAVFTLSDGSKLFFHKDGDDLRMEQHGGNPNQCLWGHKLTPEQARELKLFLTMKGF